MSTKSDTLVRRILRKSDGLGLKLSKSGIDYETLQSHGWAEVSDGTNTIMVELTDGGKLQFFLCVKHLRA
ncbi:hypothetical protein NUKP68_38590 [Klebsiella variicola]|nr:hypothetical protein NUKP68_38590 [Klebsiella variicola]